MRELTWYFDFVSPFAYLQWCRMGELPAGVAVRPVPVLFAGLLEHAGTRGPAEVPAKRLFTYRYVQWVAERDGVAFRMPDAHPFNPLPALRLAVALDADRAALDRIFAWIWRDGGAVDDPAAWAGVAAALGVEDVAAATGDPAVKARLRSNTEQAAARGVFGVPTFVDGDLLFWGVDATDMLVDHLRDPGRFERGPYARIASLPVGAARRL